VADVNGDGHPDAITADFDPTQSAPGGTIEVLLGNGDGTFRSPVSYTVPGSWVTAVYPSDVNGDGRIDLIAATIPMSATSTQGTAVFLNNGSGIFHLGQQLNTGGPEAVADLNRDGKPDLVIINVVYSAGGDPVYSLLIYAGSGNGTFAQTGPTYPLNTGQYAGRAAAVDDFNGDGNPDIALSIGNPQLTIMLGNGAGGFTPAPAMPGVDDRPSSIVTGDFNHDGHADLAVVSSQHSTVDVLLGHGDGTFGFRAIYGTLSPAMTAVLCLRCSASRAARSTRPQSTRWGRLQTTAPSRPISTATAYPTSRF
jgi:hypothetical protein